MDRNSDALEDKDDTEDAADDSHDDVATNEEYENPAEIQSQHVTSFNLFSISTLSTQHKSEINQILFTFDY